MMRALLGSACFCLAACATRTALHPLPPAPAATEDAAIKLAQLGFGTQAHFAYCLSPLCPDVTPKALPTVDAVFPDAGPSTTPLGRNETAAPDPSARTPGGLRATILFANDQATLDTEAIRRLDALLSAMPRAAHLLITGYTDSTGPQDANDRIAHARANATAVYLRKQAPLSPDRTEIHARGRCCYVAPNRTAEGRARNRRVEIAIAFSAPRSR